MGICILGENTLATRHMTDKLEKNTRKAEGGRDSDPGDLDH